MTTLDVAIRARFLNQFGAGTKAAERDLKGVTNAAAQIGKGRAADKLAADLAKAGGRAKVASRDVQALRRETDRLGSSRGGSKAAADLEKIGRAARMAKRDMEGLGREHGRILGGRGTAPRGAAAAGGIGAGEVGAAAAIGRLGMRAVAPVGAMMLAKKAFDQSVDVDAAWAEVRKKVNDADEEQFKGLDKTIRRLSLDLGIGRAELMGLTAEAGAAGVAYGDLERFMVLTGKAAVGWDMLPREASEKLAFMKSAMGMDIAQLDVLANKINALGDNSAAKERDILEMFGRVGSAAREAGVDTDSTLAMLTAVRSGGMEPEVVSRWFGALTGGLRTASIAPKRVEKGLQLLGLSAKQVSQGMKKDAIGTLMMLFERLEKSPNAVEAATQIFGREWWDETMRAKGGIGEIRKQLEFIRNPANYKGSLDKTFGYQAATAKNHLVKLGELVSRIGEGLTSWTMGPFNQGVDAAIEKMRQLETRAGWWDRWSAAEQARLEALGVLQPTTGEVQGPPMPEGMDDAPAWIKRFRKWVYGDERTADTVFGEWWFGKPGAKDDELKASGDAGRDAARKERADSIRGMIDQRQRLERMLGDPRFPDQEGMRVRAGSLDEKLKAALGSPDLGPVAREVMEQYTEAISAEGTRATAEAQRIAAELVRILSITARPTIDVPVPKPSPGGPVGKQSSGPTIHQHIYGGDAARVARLAQREQERSIRSTRNGALHEGWAWT